MDIQSKQMKAEDYLEQGKYKEAAIQLRSITKFLKQVSSTELREYWGNLETIACIEFYELDNPEKALEAVNEAIECYWKELFKEQGSVALTERGVFAISRLAVIVGEIAKKLCEDARVHEIQKYLLSVYVDSGNEEHPEAVELQKIV